MGKRRHAKKEEADARGQGMFRALHHKAIRPGSRADLLTLGNPPRPALILAHFSLARPQSSAHLAAEDITASRGGQVHLM